MAKKKALDKRPAYDAKRRTVVVTGAYSFIGSEVLRALDADPRYERLIAVDIRKPAYVSPKLQFHKIDLTLPSADEDLAIVLQRESVDTVVHAAFLSAPTHSAGWAHELESIGTMHVLNAAAEHRLRKFVLWSQTVAYGANPLNPNFLTEEHELRGAASKSRYVRDKADVEKQVRRFAAENPSTIVTVLRTAPTLGPTIRNFATRFFARPISPTLMGFDPLMQCVHERDVIEAFVRVVDEDFAGAFNIAADGVLPYSTILAMMGKIPLPLPHFVAYPLSQALWMTQVFDSPPNFLDFLRYLCVADTSKAKRVFGFAPRYDIKATVHDFLGVAPPPGSDARSYAEAR